MANAFLNPTVVPGMWGDYLPTPNRSTPATVSPATPEMAAEANAVAPRPKAIAWVKMAPDILRAMASAAMHAGRSAGDVWSEAARDWLLRKSLEADYDVLSYAPSRKRDDSVLEEMRSRLWGGIDSVMSDIRQSRPTIS